MHQVDTPLSLETRGGGVAAEKQGGEAACARCGTRRWVVEPPHLEWFIGCGGCKSIQETESQVVVATGSPVVAAAKSGLETARRWRG